MNTYTNKNENYLNDLFEELFNTQYENKSKILKADILENETEYTILMDIPGYNKEDVKISYENEYLTIKASRNDVKDEKSKYITRERYYGTASRSFYIGKVNESSIKASFVDGVLKITITKEIAKKEEKKYISID